MTGDPTLRSVLARAMSHLTWSWLSWTDDVGDDDERRTEAFTNAAGVLARDPALAAAERVLAAAVAWERGRLDDTEAFVTLVEAVHAYRSAVEAR